MKKVPDKNKFVHDIAKQNFLLNPNLYALNFVKRHDRMSSTKLLFSASFNYSQKCLVSDFVIFSNHENHTTILVHQYYTKNNEIKLKALLIKLYTYRCKLK